MPEPQTIPAPYAYNHQGLSDLLLQRIAAQTSAEGLQWLEEKGSAVNHSGSNAFNVAFAAMPRKVGKQALAAAAVADGQMQALRPGLILAGWTIDRLARVWLLLQLDPAEQDTYLHRIESLFAAAEMNELAALYAALPLYAYPEAWRHRCTEGIRSNIGLVLEAVICNNPYPAEQLDERAWNQLVMKAFFTDKRVDQVLGFDQRVNPELAQILLDFAHERWAAGRPVPPLLWRGVAPFINEHNFADLERAYYSENSLDRDAAALALAQSHYAPARALLAKHPEQEADINSGALTWSALAERVAG